MWIIPASYVIVYQRVTPTQDASHKYYKPLPRLHPGAQGVDPSCNIPSFGDITKLVDKSMQVPISRPNQAA